MRLEEFAGSPKEIGPLPEIVWQILPYLRVWPENSIRRIPSSTKGYISVRNFGICESASAPKTPRIKQETPKSWTRRIPLACQTFMTDASVAAVMTAWLDRAGEAGHCWFIQQPRRSAGRGTGPGTLTSGRLIIDDARDYLPLFQIDRVFGPYGVA